MDFPDNLDNFDKMETVATVLPASASPYSCPLSVLGRRVLCRPILTPDRYGSIFAPFQKTTQEAIVHAVGPSRRDLCPGDRILYRPYSTLGITFRGIDYLLLTDDELLARLDFSSDGGFYNE